MASLNKVSLIGNVGADPELRYMPDGGEVVTVSVATSDRWKDKQTAQVKESTEWHRVVFFGRLAAVVAEYVKKGASLYIEGKLRTRKWEDENKVTRYSTEVVGNVMKMLDRKPDGSPSAPAADAADFSDDETPF